jgi:transcription elongation factor GreA
VLDVTLRIDEELERLGRDLVVDIPAAFGAALDDLAHRALVERQKHVLGNIRRLGRIRLGLQRWGAYAVPACGIGLGSEVDLRSLETGSERRCVILGPAADLAEDEIALDSPLGAALVGRGAGDTVDLSATGGSDERYQVLQVVTLRQRLGLATPSTAADGNVPFGGVPYGGVPIGEAPGDTRPGPVAANGTHPDRRTRAR